MSTTTTTATDVQVDDLEQRCREQLRPFWSKIGRHSSFPARTAEVLALVAAAEYTCNRRRIQGLWDSGRIVRPEKDNGRLQWSGTHIMQLISVLEERRYWQPLSPRHAHKRSVFESVLETTDADGRSAIEREVSQTSCAEFIRAIELSTNNVGRANLLHGLRLKLVQLGVKDDADDNRTD